MDRAAVHRGPPAVTPRQTCSRLAADLQRRRVLSRDVLLAHLQTTLLPVVTIQTRPVDGIPLKLISSFSFTFSPQHFSQSSSYHCTLSAFYDQPAHPATLTSLLVTQTTMLSDYPLFSFICTSLEAIDAVQALTFRVQNLSIREVSSSKPDDCDTRLTLSRLTTPRVRVSFWMPSRRVLTSQLPT